MPWIGPNAPTVVARWAIVAKTASLAQNAHFGHIVWYKCCGWANFAVKPVANYKATRIGLNVPAVVVVGDIVAKTANLAAPKRAFWPDLLVQVSQMGQLYS